MRCVFYFSIVFFTITNSVDYASFFSDHGTRINAYMTTNNNKADDKSRLVKNEVWAQSATISGNLQSAQHCYLLLLSWR